MSLETHFQAIGVPIPMRTNPAEFVLELMNVDFAIHDTTTHERLQWIQKSWTQSYFALKLTSNIHTSSRFREPLTIYKAPHRNFLTILLALIHRSFIKSYRDVVAYGIRIAMYTGLAIMMGTVWLKLQPTQNDIQPYINAIVCYDHIPLCSEQC